MSNVTQIKPFCEGDIENISSRIDVLAHKDLEVLILTASSGYTYTFFVNNKPGAIVGANILWPGAAQVWAITSDLIRGHGLWFTKMVDWILSESAKAHKIRRYHCIVDGTNNENIRWLYTLNFEYEFCMYRAAPDGSHVFGYVRWEA